MNTILLLGAGFSRNWGGWLAAEVFEYLLGCPEIASNPQLRKLLWKTQATGGFEAALEEVQRDYVNNPQAHGQRLTDLQAAVTRMFVDMNSAFFEKTGFEFQSSRSRTVAAFLARFDANFTLNQDLLIEHQYLDKFDISLLAPRRWDTVQLPGLQFIPSEEPRYAKSRARGRWMPLPDDQYKVAPRQQPYFKLHGSSNWQKADGGSLLVMGGQKAGEIKLHSILSRYAREFEERLNQPNTRLMVIGYGFRDEHINQAITRAVDDHGLTMFIIAPQGSDLARNLNPTGRPPAVIQVPIDLERLFERSLIGASRRGLREIFGGDTAEFNKVQRFFDDSTEVPLKRG